MSNTQQSAITASNTETATTDQSTTAWTPDFESMSCKNLLFYQDFVYLKANEPALYFFLS
jgi:hypothetical protein